MKTTNAPVRVQINLIGGRWAIFQEGTGVAMCPSTMAKGRALVDYCNANDYYVVNPGILTPDLAAGLNFKTPAA